MKSKKAKQSALPEQSILAPRDPSTDDNTDEWPEFELANVDVCLPDDPEAQTSLLEASASRPLTLRGQLAPLPEESKHLYLLSKPSNRRANIELNDVRTFSYGQYGDGSIAIWAAGKAGWYVISPSPEYQQIYNETVDAVRTFYFVVDAYRTPRRTGRGKNATVLPDYNAQELFQKCSKDMLKEPSSSRRGAEQIYRHHRFILASMINRKEGLSWSTNPLYKHLSKKYPEVDRHLKDNAQKPEKKAQTSATAPPVQDSTETGSTASNRKRKRGRPSKTTEEDAISLGSTFEHGTKTKKETDSQATGQNASNLAPPEIPSRAPAKRAGKPPLNGPRSLGRKTATPSNDDESDDVFISRHKSGLRLKTTRASKFVKRNDGMTPFSADDENHDNIDKQSTHSADVKASVGQLSALSRRPSKRRNSRLHADEGIDIPTSPSEAGNSELHAGEEQDLSIRTLHQPDPVQEDTWVCALDGCTHKVYAASDPESQSLIREHYALHAYDDDERVRMVKKLEQPSLPVGRLMDKVRLQAKLEGFPGSRVAGTRYPNTMPMAAATTAGVTQRY